MFFPPTVRGARPALPLTSILSLVVAAWGCSTPNPLFELVGRDAPAADSAPLGGAGGAAGSNDASATSETSETGNDRFVPPDSQAEFDSNTGGGGGSSGGAGGGGAAGGVVTGTGGGGGTASGPDANQDVTVKADAPLDVRDAAAPDAPMPDLPPPGCGTMVLDVSGVMKADGVAIADDGTMYFSTDDGTDGWIGKLSGGVVTERWLKIDRYTTGIVIDHARRQLYVASLSRSAVLAYDLTVPSPVATTLVAEAYGITDLAVAPAGTVHYPAQGPRMVYRAVNGKGV
ncbi:MAG TPA: hypothetical protein VGG33_24205, partial [Polyangia bacterium]